MWGTAGDVQAIVTEKRELIFHSEICPCLLLE